MERHADTLLNKKNLHYVNTHRAGCNQEEFACMGENVAEAQQSGQEEWVYATFLVLEQVLDPGSQPRGSIK
jgi:hypothetical protein